jgi:hypothetical protein
MHLMLSKTFLKYIKFLTVKKKTEKKKIRKIPGMGEERTQQDKKEQAKKLKKKLTRRQR